VDVEAVAREIARALRLRRVENFDLHRRHVNPGWADLLERSGYGRRFVRAAGIELEDEHGERYVDFLSGYGVLNLGHNHPAVKAALRAVLDEDVPGFTQVECGLLPGLAAERLARTLPGDLEKVFFCSSGSEAVEAALKLARAATGRKRFVACDGAYHGATLGALGLSGRPSPRDRFRPLVPGIEHVPYDDIDALRKTLRWGDVAAFVVEPVLGEGGAVVPRPEFLREAVDLVHDRGALLIADEVQTGLGRTGRMFAFERSGIVPDAVTLAKTLGGGLVPVGALVARDEPFRRAYGSAGRCLDHTTTFGGGPLAMAAVLATLRVIEDEGLVGNAERQGRRLREGLDSLKSKHSSIRDVRGVGLMLGVKFSDAARGLLENTPFAKLGAASAALFAQYVALRLIREHRFVTQVAVNDGAVLKVMPPLSVTPEAVDRFVAAVDAVLGDAGHAAAVARLAAEFLKPRGA
jgi:acetylornithine/succinyldiaminopimelate/putrescine aminotransferase